MVVEPVETLWQPTSFSIVQLSVGRCRSARVPKGRNFLNRRSRPTAAPTYSNNPASRQAASRRDAISLTRCKRSAASGSSDSAPRQAQPHRGGRMIGRRCEPLPTDDPAPRQVSTAGVAGRQAGVECNATPAEKNRIANPHIQLRRTKTTILWC